MLSLLVPATLSSQVALYPEAVEPAAWERFALRVVNQEEAPVVTVEIALPEVLQILGTDQAPGWTAERVPATGSTPPMIVWRGGEVPTGSFREFPFIARVPADARRRQLVFPVKLGRRDGSETVFGPGGAGRALVVPIRGTTGISAWGAFALAGAAMGLAVLALGVALLARRVGPGCH